MKITATCSVCGYKKSYTMNKTESDTLKKYRIYGRQMGYIQDRDCFKVCVNRK